MGRSVSVIDPGLRLGEKQAALYRAQSPYRLSVGGIRSAKTWTALLYGVLEYLLKYSGSDMLIIRKKFRELETGAISDFKTIFNPAAYTWNESKHIATFKNGSRAIFGSCPHDIESEIMQYLGQGYPFILADEVAQFSPEIWEMLVSRNTINAGCRAAKDGSMPKSCLWGCTNPIGPWWTYYKSLFIDGKPFPVPEGVTRDSEGKFWIEEHGQKVCVYDPGDYAWTHSTVLDNKPLLERDPGIIDRLNKLPPAKRAKMLFGYLDTVEGQYFECWEPEHHVINLTLHPDAIEWLDWQKTWCGWDWGIAHANAVYWFTRAMVKRPNLDSGYSLKTVCFKELILTGVGMDDMVERVVSASIRPDGQRVHPSAIYFSHEKFNRHMEAHSPADEISRALQRKQFPSVSRATTDRIGRASFMHHMLQSRQMVILNSCSTIVDAVPQLQRNPDRLDDVKKVDNTFDDAYDAFSYGLFGQLGPGRKPEIEEKIEAIQKISNPFRRKLEAFKFGMSQMQSGRPKARWEYRIRMPR